MPLPKEVRMLIACGRLVEGVAKLRKLDPTWSLQSAHAACKEEQANQKAWFLAEFERYLDW